MQSTHAFPTNQRTVDIVLLPYAAEISLRARWVLAANRELLQAITSRTDAVEVHRHAMDLVGHAVVIARIIAPVGARESGRALAKERARLISKRWPQIPREPPSLRRVRDHYEHIDEKFDKWVITSERHTYLT